jgi:hypothetical protein
MSTTRKSIVTAWIGCFTLVALTGAAGCGGGTGACVYTRASSDLYEAYQYRCVNVGSYGECKERHSSGRFDSNVCCNPKETRVDNPDACHG